MRIALWFPGCHRRGGIERVVLECANFLQRRGHHIDLYTSDCDTNAVSPGVHVHYLRLPGPGSIPRLVGYARQSRALIRTHRAVADVHGAFGVQSPPGGVMWVPSVHRAWIETSRRQRGLTGRMRQLANLTHPIILSMERDYFGGRRYRSVIALTEQVKADLMRFYDVPETDIAVLPNGYAPAEFNIDRAAALRAQMRARLRYTEDHKVVVFVANELDRKGFVPLARAIALLDDPQIRLLVVGRDSPSRYATLLGTLNIAGRVDYVGSTPDTACYYAAADAFALPTTYEPWGLVIVEALACGLPVLTSRLAGAACVIRQGENGYLLDNPSDVPEIAKRLQLTLDLTTPPSSIAASVASLTWDHVLQQYEVHLTAVAGAK